MSGNVSFHKKLVIGMVILVICAVVAYWYIPSEEQMIRAKELCQSKALRDGAPSSKCEDREEWSKFLK